ncbi:MAG: hypothetical protein V7606_1850 [Burkholderiales bacterium]
MTPLFRASCFPTMRRVSLHRCDGLRHSIPRWSGAARYMQSSHLLAWLFGYRISCQCSLAFAICFVRSYTVLPVSGDRGQESGISRRHYRNHACNAAIHPRLVRSIPPCDAAAQTETGAGGSIGITTVALSPRLSGSGIRVGSKSGQPLLLKVYLSPVAVSGSSSSRWLAALRTSSSVGTGSSTNSASSSSACTRSASSGRKPPACLLHNS